MARASALNSARRVGERAALDRDDRAAGHPFNATLRRAWLRGAHRVERAYERSDYAFCYFDPGDPRIARRRAVYDALVDRHLGPYRRAA